jgi:hypothetical protein
MSARPRRLREEQRAEQHAARQAGRERQREQVLAVIARHGREGATALAIGNGMVAGTLRASRLDMSAKEMKGLAMATRLVREGVVVATRGNRFMLAKLADEAVAPALRREDMPPPGFRRVPGAQG